MNRPPSTFLFARLIRGSGSALFGACCWLAVVGFAVQIFITRHAPTRPFWGYLSGFEEPIGFAWGFAVAGAVCMALAVGGLGSPRRGIVMGGILLAMVGSMTALAIGGYPRLVVSRFGPSPVSIKSDQRLLISYIRIGAALGAVSGSVLAISAVAFGAILRRIGDRRIRLGAFAALVAVAVLLIPVATSRLSDLAGILGLEHWGSDFQAIMGAATGATTGALAGLLVALLLTRAFAGSGPGPASPTSEEPPPAL